MLNLAGQHETEVRNTYPGFVGPGIFIQPDLLPVQSHHPICCSSQRTILVFKVIWPCWWIVLIYQNCTISYHKQRKNAKNGEDDRMHLFFPNVLGKWSGHLVFRVPFVTSGHFARSYGYSRSQGLSKITTRSSFRALTFLVCSYCT